MSRKKYLFFSAGYGSDTPGGGVTFSKSVVEEFLNQGHECHVITAEIPHRFLRGMQKHFDNQLLHIYEVTSKELSRYSHQYSSELYDSTRRLIEKISPDYIHIHNFHGLMGGLWAAVDSKVPTVYTALDFGMMCITWYFFDGSLTPCSGPEKSKCAKCVKKNYRIRWRDFFYHIYWMAMRVARIGAVPGHKRFFDLKYRNYFAHSAENIDKMLLLLSRFDHIIAPSPPIRDAVKNFTSPTTKIHTLLYPVAQRKMYIPSPDEQKSPTIDPTLKTGPLKFIFLGHNDVIKGWPFFLQVLENLPDGLQIEVIDGGDNQLFSSSISKRITRYLKQSFLAESSAVGKLIQEADATLFPSLWHENSSLAVVETLANGRPIIASDQAGIRELIQPGKNGYLLKPGDLDTWINAFVRFSENPSLIRSLPPNCFYKKTTKEYVEELQHSVEKSA